MAVWATVLSLRCYRLAQVTPLMTLTASPICTAIWHFCMTRQFGVDSRQTSQVLTSAEPRGLQGSRWSTRANCPTMLVQRTT